MKAICRLITFSILLLALASAFPPAIIGEDKLQMTFLQVDDGNPDTLQRLYAQHRTPLVMISDAIYLPAAACVPPEEQRHLGGDTEGRRLGGDIAKRDTGGDSEGRRLGGDTEGRHLGGDIAKRDTGGNSEGRRLGGDTEGRHLGGDIAKRDTGGDSEGRRLGGDTEGRHLGGSVAVPTCSPLEGERRGFKIEAAPNLTIQVLSGERPHRLLNNRTVVFD